MKKVSFRLPAELVEECERKAEHFKLPLSHVLRDRFLETTLGNTSTVDASSSLLPALQGIEEKLVALQVFHPKEAVPSSQDDPLFLEILFLLRAFLFERNAQILKSVDEKLDRRFGKDRRRPG